MYEREEKAAATAAAATAAAAKLQSGLTLRDPVDCSLPGSSVHGIFQARVLEWGAKFLLYKLNIGCCEG